ncbi:hypothetical protein [Roseateles puraquae]|uniref:hypothetical protein n=1 Tax=Roseateles puraquae TaxID=431059 RepID=UPI001186556A|nr:hypothetical protein [Roseateles puraquae]MDG0856961.1 hypothetical protein [Roseateles puraquae]
MLSELTWPAALLGLLPIVARFVLEKLSGALQSDKPRRSEHELHHRILAELQKSKGDDSIYAQQLNRSLLEELVPSAKTHEDGLRVLHLKDWRKLTRLTKTIKGIVEIKADEAGVPRVVWAENWARWLRDRPACTFIVAFWIYAIGFTATFFFLAWYSNAWMVDGLGMQVSTFLACPPAILLSASLTVFGFSRSVKILDGYSARRYSRKLTEADLLIEPAKSTVPVQAPLLAHTPFTSYRPSVARGVAVAGGRRRGSMVVDRYQRG